jgi:hypothetical protein
LSESPGLDEGAVDGEVLAAHQTSVPGLANHEREKLPTNLMLEESVTVLGEGRGIERRAHIDDTARGAWIHDDAIDGLADFVFWGRDADALAAVVNAPLVSSGTYGWTNLPIDDAIAVGRNAEDERLARKLKLATDFRPHSHHFLALEALRSSEHQAGGVDVGGARALLWMTGGDAIFPVYVDSDADGRLLQVRVQLWADDNDDGDSGHR